MSIELNDKTVEELKRMIGTKVYWLSYPDKAFKIWKGEIYSFTVFGGDAVKRGGHGEIEIIVEYTYLADSENMGYGLMTHYPAGLYLTEDLAQEEGLRKIKSNLLPKRETK